MGTMKSYSMFYFAGCDDNTWDDDGNCKLCGGSMKEFGGLQGEYVKTSDHIEKVREAQVSLIDSFIKEATLIRRGLLYKP